MPIVQLGTVTGSQGFPNRQKSAPPNTSTTEVGTPLNYTSDSALDTRLLAIGGAYTAAYLQKMNINDKTFALRNADDPTTI